MPEKKKVIEELDFLSDRVSTQVRTVAVGLIIVTWGLLMGESRAVIPASGCLRTGLLSVGVLAVIAMFCDYLQYLSGYLNARSLLEDMEETGAQEGQYDKNVLSYQLRGFFFCVKQWVLFGAIGLFIAVIVLYLNRTAQS